MSKQEIIKIINDLTNRHGVNITIHQASPDAIMKVANIYNLTVFTPEEHPLNFYFCSGWIDMSGQVVTKKGNAKCKFTLTSLNYEDSKIYTK